MLNSDSQITDGSVSTMLIMRTLRDHFIGQSTVSGFDVS